MLTHQVPTKILSKIKCCKITTETFSLHKTGCHYQYTTFWEEKIIGLFLFQSKCSGMNEKYQKLQEEMKALMGLKDGGNKSKRSKIDKKLEEVKGFLTVTKTTKPCPNCNVAIEKNHGWVTYFMVMPCSSADCSSLSVVWRWVASISTGRVPFRFLEDHWPCFLADESSCMFAIRSCPVKLRSND